MEELIARCDMLIEKVNKQIEEDDKFLDDHKRKLEEIDSKIAALKLEQQQ